jgi:hypothetical protein
MLQLQPKRPVLLGSYRLVLEQQQHRHLLAPVQLKTQLLPLALQPQLLQREPLQPQQPQQAQQHLRQPVTVLLQPLQQPLQLLLQREPLQPQPQQPQQLQGVVQQQQQ